MVLVYSPMYVTNCQRRLAAKLQLSGAVKVGWHPMCVTNYQRRLAAKKLRKKVFTTFSLCGIIYFGEDWGFGQTAPLTYLTTSKIPYGGYLQNGKKSSVCGDCAA